MKPTIMKRKFRKMIYLLLPAIAGVAIVLQTALSGKISKDFGTIETVILIHLFGLLAALLVYFVQGNTSFAFFGKSNLLAVIAGALGVVIIFTISKSFVANGALTTVMISVVIQMGISKVIDHFGLFGIEKNPVNLTQLAAIGLMIVGVVILQLDK